MVVILARRTSRIAPRIAANRPARLTAAAVPTPNRTRARAMPLAALTARFVRAWSTQNASTYTLRRAVRALGVSASSSSSSTSDEKVRVGDVVRVECVDLASTGEGVCRLPSGMVLLCSGAAPGEVLEARVEEVSRTLARGTKTRTARRAAVAVDPPCPYYDACGGCAWQHIDYSAQVERKGRTVEEALVRIGHVADAERAMKKCVGAESTTRYRNKMEFAFASDGRGGVTVGLRPRGANDAVVDLDRGCLLQSEEADGALAAVRASLKKLRGRVDAFDRTTGEGTLRSVTIRTATGEDGSRSVMVDLATTSSDDELKSGPMAEFIADISNAKGVTSVVHTQVQSEAELRKAGVGRNSKFVKGGKKPVAKKKVRAVFGENKLVETLNGVKFELSSASFFQTNTEQAARLVREVVWACDFSGDKSEIVLDLFCGVGTMGLSVAANAKRVMGWEVVPEAVADASRNAQINGITNADFFRVDLARLNPTKGVKALLTTPDGEELPMPDIIITDPARPGMDASLIAILRAIGARKIVYVSCNPSTQARDLALLSAVSQGPHDAAYELKSCTPVDMFPHTAHVESVAVLERASA